MKKLIEFLIDGCWHRWQTARKIDLAEGPDSLPIGTRYIYQCSKCFKVKKVDLT